MRSPEQITTCPRCEARIVWVDREPSPELLYRFNRVLGKHEVVACGACSGRELPKPPPHTPSHGSSRGGFLHPEVVATVRRDVGGAVELLDEGWRVFDGARNLWRKLTS